MSRINAYRCDTQGCNVVGLAHERNVLAVSPREHYCVDHYPYERCTDCRRKVRPYSAQQVSIPDTTPRGSSDPLLCLDCHNTEEARKNALTPEQHAHVLGVVANHAETTEDLEWLKFALFGGTT